MSIRHLAFSWINSPLLLFIDPSPEILSQLPVYFRVKPTLRTPSGRRCRKSRTVFTDLQLRVLEKTFAEQRYLDTSNRAKLAQTLGLNETQVKTWFQNRRMKWKKESTPNSQESSSTSKTDEASAPGVKEKSNEKDTESRRMDPGDKSNVRMTTEEGANWRAGESGRNIISISILLWLPGKLILEFNLFCLEASI